MTGNYHHKLADLLMNLDVLYTSRNGSFLQRLQYILQEYVQTEDLEIFCNYYYDNQDSRKGILYYPEPGVCFFNIARSQIIFNKLPHASPFTQDDLDYIKFIANILTDKSYTSVKPSQLITTAEMKEDLLNDMKVGFITLDESCQVLKINETAQCYLKQMYPEHTSADACKKVIDTFEKSRIPNDFLTQTEKTIDSFTIIFRTTISLDSFGYANKYYNIEIKKCLTAQVFYSKYTLSSREIEIVEYLYEGLTADEISEKIFISINTFRTHLKNIYKKTNVSNQRQLMYLYSSYTGHS